jgi:hypothetical protein
MLDWLLRNTQKRIFAISKRGTNKVALPINPLERNSRQFQMLQTPTNGASTPVILEFIRDT